MTKLPEYIFIQLPQDRYESLPKGANEFRSKLKGALEWPEKSTIRIGTGSTGRKGGAAYEYSHKEWPDLYFFKKK